MCCSGNTSVGIQMCWPLHRRFTNQARFSSHSANTYQGLLGPRHWAGRKQSGEERGKVLKWPKCSLIRPNGPLAHQYLKSPLSTGCIQVDRFFLSQQENNINDALHSSAIDATTVWLYHIPLLQPRIIQPVILSGNPKSFPHFYHLQPGFDLDLPNLNI
jgi:hypothetical protein